MNISRLSSSVAALVLVVGSLSTVARAASPKPAAVQASAMRPIAAQPAARQNQGEQAFAALDANKDKVLSLAEFQVGYARMQQAIAVELRLREQFQSVDIDRSGAISPFDVAETCVYLATLGPNAIVQQIVIDRMMADW